jgi:hypothetical protein
VADKQTIILHALSIALESNKVWPLFNKKGVQGLFPLSAPGKEAAKYSIEKQFFKLVGHTTKSFSESVAITAIGARALLEGLKVTRLLENATDIMRASHENADVDSNTEEIHFYERIEKAVGEILKRLNSSNSKELVAVEKHIFLVLKEWSDEGRIGDCQLNYIYQKTLSLCPGITPGAFHDGLRGLSQKKLVELHPWTGPLYEIPQPELAMMSGHEIACYASLGPGAAEFDPNSISFAVCGTE